MVILNLRDGSSRKFDLADPSQLEALHAATRGPRVTGAWLILDSRAVVLPMPGGFRAARIEAEIVADREGNPMGEKLALQADDVRLEIVCYHDVHTPARTSLTRTGKPRWQPG